MPTEVVELSLSVESGYGPLWRRLRPAISKVCEHCPRNAMVDHERLGIKPASSASSTRGRARQSASAWTGRIYQPSQDFSCLAY